MAKKHRILLPVLALLLIGACSRNEEIEQPTSPSGGVEVAILCDNTKEPQVYSLPDGTRTWIDDNDWASTRWDKNGKRTVDSVETKYEFDSFLFSVVVCI